MRCWFHLLLLTAFVKASTQDEQEDRGVEEEDFPPTQPDPQAGFQYHQPSLDLDDLPWPHDRQPSIDYSLAATVNGRRTVGHLRPSSVSVFSLETFRQQNSSERYRNNPDDLIRTLNFKAISVLFEADPERQFLLANKSSPALVEIFGSLQDFWNDLEDMNPDLIAFIVEVLDAAGKLHSDDLINLYLSFNHEFKDVLFRKRFITLFTPIQTDFDCDIDILVSGIDFTDADLDADEQFYAWNVSSWLLNKRFEMLTADEYNPEIGNFMVEASEIRARFFSSEIPNSEWKAAFDALNSHATSINVVEVAKAWFGFDWSTSPDSVINYDKLSTTKRIQFRFMLYLCILFPQNEANRQLLPSMAPSLSSFHDSRDLNSVEIKFLFDLCTANTELGGQVLLHYFIRYPNSAMSKLIATKLKDKQLEQFQDPLAQVYLALNYNEDIHFIGQDENIFKTGRALRESRKFRQLSEESSETEAEEGQETAAAQEISEERLSGRKRPISSSFNSSEKHHSLDYSYDHFLTERQISQMPVETCGLLANQRTTVVRVAYPDRVYLYARIDHFLQHLSSPDFGEMEWIESGHANPKKDQEIKTFFKDGMAIVRALSRVSIDKIDVEFIGSTAYGRGLTLETLNMLGQACVLPFLELFYYDVALKGFLPLPLLAPEVMAQLGALSGLLIKYEMPVDWNFAPEYAAFLYYDEPHNETVAQQATRFYAPIFQKFDEMAANEYCGDLLDFMPTTFASHFPFEITHCEVKIPARPLNLYSYGAGTTPGPFLRLDALMSEKRARLLRAPSLSSASQESKSEGTDLAESKSAEPVNKKVQARKALVAAVKPVLVGEIALRMKQGRFEFQRYFLGNFRSNTHLLFDLQLMTAFWKVVKKPFTPESFVLGLDLTAGTELEVRLDDSQATITAEEAFKRIIHESSDEELRQFYWFSTGCFQLPANGLSSKPITVRFVPNRMSVGRTCFRECHVGVYSPFSVMKERFLTAIYNTANYDLQGENRFGFA